MNFRKERLKDLAFLTVAVVLVQFLLSKFVYPLFGQSTQTIFSISPTTALSSQVFGDKIIGVLTGLVSFNLGQWQVWVSMFLGAFILLFAGYWVYDMKWFPFKGKNVYQKLAVILLLGTAVLYVVLLLTKMSAISTLAVPLLIGLLINYVVIALAVTMLAKTKLGKVLRI